VESIVENPVSSPLAEEDELKAEEKGESIKQISFTLVYFKGKQSNQKILDKSEILKQKEQATLSQKRSFLVRMVSDPKCYNPKIVRHLTMTGFRKMNEDVARDLSLREAIGRSKIQEANLKYFRHDQASSSFGSPVEEANTPSHSTRK
uniref:Ubiquitinyl hydrolase 1 n=1 Tax=Elaeophora elaphi TaxID=1147741 RepID=A0A0R3RIE9_9BILA